MTFRQIPNRFAPPLAAQLQNQVRTSSGMTWRGSEPIPAAREDRPKFERVTVVPTERLLAHLRKLAEAGAAMPSLAELGDAAGLTMHERNHLSERVMRELVKLAELGELEVWQGNAHGHPGRFAVRLADGRILRQPKTPRWVFGNVADAAHTVGAEAGLSVPEHPTPATTEKAAGDPATAVCACGNGIPHGGQGR